ncbi:hypothetical protein WKV44_05230 [Spirochaetia bacterium 38H-sp]|uniref:Peptide/nickel transport system permease protein n=1 Tax=Rarispira pelagica TaxID=3141764 RepID=A0ABU9UBA8_9SPIR
MKKLYNKLIWVFCFIFLSPLILSWFPTDIMFFPLPEKYKILLFDSFRQLTLTLGATLLVSSIIAIFLGFLSVLNNSLGRALSSFFKAIESIPSILIALFCYAPVAGYLAQQSADISSLTSLGVFVFAATIIVLPEAVREIAIPLGDLYHRKYSLSFRSYGFTKAHILTVLIKTNTMLMTIRHMAAGILLKTLVLDCSFGFVIQLGFGSYGTPAHHSPGALIAANRDALFAWGNPVLFWIPSLMLTSVSIAFLLVLNQKKEVM